METASLEYLLVPVPPLPEQRAIAAVLSKIQAAVEVQDKIVATLKELKAATMAKLFREGLRGEPLKQTEIGEIPESWGVVQLAELCTADGGFIQTGPFGSQLHSSDYVHNGVPIVNPTHLENDRIRHASIPQVTRADAERLHRQCRRSPTSPGAAVAISFSVSRRAKILAWQAL
jgi:type I restriction enzyme S subunit